jgi:glutamate/tyrosine decarboxylase-like PLP-dependent enzyme/quercetin dioxygenase-like cupin family protein
MSLETTFDDRKNDEYRRTVLQSNESFEVVDCEWKKSSLSHMHQHGWSHCLVLVQSGTFENHLNMGMKIETSVLSAGQMMITPVGAKHEVRCLSETGRTFHVYMPRLLEEEKTDSRFRTLPIAQLKKAVDLQLSSAPVSVAQLKAILDSVRQHSISTDSPYFMNQLFSGVLPETLLAEELLLQTKTTMATYEASPVYTAIEIEVVKKLGELIGWGAHERDGVCVPGGSAANFMALHCARQKRFPLLRKTGSQGERLNIFISADAHYSFKKACVALGIGTDNIRIIPVDTGGKMIPEALETAITDCIARKEIPLLACATAGTTVQGAFDPISEMAEICQRHGVWLHVDGAWGGPALFAKSLYPLIKDIHKADSVTFDAHKLFGSHLTCSFFLDKHAGLLLEANDVTGGDYLFHTDGKEVPLDRGRLAWQCGRSADAVSFWTIWKSLGTDGLGKFVDHLLNVRQETAEWAATQPRLKILGNPEYLNLCIRVQPPRGDENPTEWSKKVRERLRENNQALVNYSSDNNGTFLRLIFAHPFLQFSHVKQILEWALAVQ